MTNNVDFLLVGGGIASATAAEMLRKEGEGKIVIISAESSLPYHRPPLSKGFLLGKQKKPPFVLEENYYRDHKIDVMLGTKALAVDPENKIVNTDHAGEFHFGKLLIATGSRPNKINVPGAGLTGIHYLRTIGDAEALIRAMRGAKRAVVVGGSFIGTELASSFTQKGIQVTIITMGDTLYHKLSSPEISEFFVEYSRANGVQVVFGETVREFKGKDRVTNVITTAGKRLPCDFVAIGIGVTPDIDFLHGSGIKVDNGIVVNEYMQTNKPDIYAAGDVANFFDPVFRRHRRIEHWDNAIKQGQIAARNMIGNRQTYRTVSYFFSDVFDLSFDFLGDTADTDERILRGSIKEKSFSVLYLKEDVLQAMFFLGRPPTEAKAAESLIINRVNLKDVKKKLHDNSYPLEAIANQTVLVLQGGGALGAFECGAVKAMEQKGIYPDIVAGVSIGAFNASIIAGNPKNATAALEAFWDEIALRTPEAPNEETRQLLSSLQALVFGSPRFFRPRWLMPILGPDTLPIHWTSYYDPSPVKELLCKYIDFDTLKYSSVRLLISAVNVETAELETFDSYRDNITPDHILASGSLPPGFPWTTIDGRHYWDGGIVSNTPLDQVIELCGSTGKNVYIVELYPRKRSLPRNMLEVIARKDEIFFSEKIRNDIHTRDLVDKYRKLIEGIISMLEPTVVEKIKQIPTYIQTMGDPCSVSITRIVREGEEYEYVSEDHDFSWNTIKNHKEKGYKTAYEVLEKEAERKRSNQRT